MWLRGEAPCRAALRQQSGHNGSLLASFGISCVAAVVADDKNSIIEELQKRASDVDAILTSGGAWGSERDLIIGILDKTGLAKAVPLCAYGARQGHSLWAVGERAGILSAGGPLSNQMAFLQLALPAILRMSGDNRHPLPTVPARLIEDVKGRHQAWTEFKDAILTLDGEGAYKAALFKNKSRLQAIAGSSGFICIPEGKDYLRSGRCVPVQLLIPSYSY